MKTLKLNNHSKAILYMVIACWFFAINNNLIKMLSINVPVMPLVFYKNFISLLWLFPIVILCKERIFCKQNFNKYNLLRSVIDVISIGLWFKAIEGSPISQAAAVTLLTPFFISVIAIFAFKERIKRYKWGLMLIGFCGAIVVIQPTSDGFNVSIIYAVCASLLWALSAVLFKKLTSIQNSIVIIFFLKVMKSFIALPLLFYDFYVLDFQQILYLSVLGICTNLAVFFIAKAYKSANISIVVPFDFLRLVFTAIIACLVFQEVLSLNTIYGSVVILVASTLLAEKIRRSSTKLNRG